MPIVCFLDWGDRSRVSNVGALLASRLKTSCHLAQSTGERADCATHAARATWVGAHLADRARHMRALIPDVHTHVLPGPAERQVGSLAARLNAELIVTAASTHDDEQPALLAQHTRTPVLAVREQASFDSWALQVTTLRVAVALAGEADAAPVLAMVRRIAEAAPCEVIFLHLTSDELSVAKRRMEALLQHEPAEAVCTLHVEKLAGDRAKQLVTIASARGAQLVVTGSRAMSHVSRFWAQSVSQRVIAEAPCSVLCVPVGASRTSSAVHCVLAATDLTAAGDLALKLASRVTEPGGVVHAVYVSIGPDAERVERALTRLDASMRALRGRELSWQLHVLHAPGGQDVASTLEQAARSLAVDAVCVGRTAAAQHETIATLLSKVGCPVLIADGASW